MKLLSYSHTKYIQRSMFPARIPRSRAVLISPKNLKKNYAHQGKLEPKSLTQVTIQTAYYTFSYLPITVKTYKNKNIYPKHKQELGRLHQTIISFAKTKLSQLIRLLYTSFFLIQVHCCTLRLCRGRSAWSSSQRRFSQLLQIVQLHHATHYLLPLEFGKHLNCPA